MFSFAFGFLVYFCAFFRLGERNKSFSGLNNPEGIKLLMFNICMNSIKKRKDRL